MAYQEWANSWQNQKWLQLPRQLAIADPENLRAVKLYQSRKSDRWKISLQESSILLQRNLKRAQSSIAMQIRTELMELNLYLYRRKVPGVYSPSCPCGYQPQNPKRMIMSCLRWSNGREEIRKEANDRSYEAMLNNLGDIKRIIQWIEQFQIT